MIIFFYSVFLYLFFAGIILYNREKNNWIMSLYKNKLKKRIKM